mgnify:CR=1 FL=1
MKAVEALTLSLSVLLTIGLRLSAYYMASRVIPGLSRFFGPNPGYLEAQAFRNRRHLAGSKFWLLICLSYFFAFFALASKFLLFPALRD